MATVEIPDETIKILKAMHGCLNGSCNFGRIPSDVQTNGSCQCHHDILNTRVLITTQQHAIMKVLKAVRSIDV